MHDRVSHYGVGISKVKAKHQGVYLQRLTGYLELAALVENHHRGCD
jgi:hypothetical protein